MAGSRTKGIRCSYHGWLMDETGRCLEQPYEDTTNPKPSKAGCETKAYPVKECAGLLFAYLGPLPAPELPVWEPFTWRNGFREIVLADVPCNLFQCQENSIDPVHFEWMHDNWGSPLRGGDANAAPKHLKLKFEAFEHGFIYKRVREGQSEEDRYWTVGRVALWPNGFYLGSHFEWRVPVDDENTLSVAWFFMRVPKGREPYVQERVPTWKSPIQDDNGRWITSHVINQDIVAWVGQGRIADRTKEHLRSSDIGITMMRNRFFEEIEAMAAGKEPGGIIRSANAAQCIALPNMARELNTEGLTLAEFDKDPILRQRLKEFRHHYGQPAEVRREFVEAMGIRELMRTQVAIIGGGPAGMLLSHILDRNGIDSIVIERQSRAYVLERIRAGVLENGSVELLREVGLGERMDRDGHPHHGSAIAWEGRRISSSTP